MSSPRRRAMTGSGALGQTRPTIEYNADGSLRSVNLDRKNPRAKEDITHLPSEQLANDILAKERRMAEILGELKALLARKS